MTWFDGIDFTGPVEIDSLPSEPGVYLITTDASGGVKLIGVYGAADMNADAKINPKKDCWQKNRKDTDPVAYYLLEKDPSKRDSVCAGIVYRRFYDLPCNDPPKDDF